MTEADNPRAVAGGNNPPPPTLAEELAAIVERLDRDYAGLWARANELRTSFTNAPATVDSDATAGQVAALRKMIRECGVALEAARKAAKSHYDALAAGVQGRFMPTLDALRGALQELERRETAWLSAKAKAEQEKRDAELKAAREREAALRREAEEAERQRLALARMAEEAATAEQAEAIAEAQADADAEAQRQRDAALLAQAEVGQRQRAVEEAPNRMAKSTSTYGASSTLRRSWSFRNLDRDKLDLDKLRPYLDTASLEKAVREAIRKGARPAADGSQPIAGVEIFEDLKSTNR